jgi:hypothetical protein
MPRMNGIEFLQAQTQKGCMLDNRNKAIISGQMYNEQKKMVDRLGCKFFQKPFKLSELSEWLDDCEKRMDLSEPLDNF